MSKNTGLTI